MTPFPTITLDPPWPETGGGGRGTGKHYETVSVQKMPQLILMAEPFEPADDAHMYLWTTTMHLQKSMWLMGMLSFQYTAIFPWVKTGSQIGMGYYFRTKAEYVLFGVRGQGSKVRTKDRNVIGLIEAPRREHSRKPQEFYDLVEARSFGPYLELFARPDAPRPGWTYWGNEVAEDGQ